MSTKTNREPSTVVSSLSQWKVIVHNDEIHTYEEVMGLLIEVIKMDAKTALLKTIEVDKQEMAIVKVTHKEHAELIQSQLMSKKPIKVTIEPN